MAETLNTEVGADAAKSSAGLPQLDVDTFVPQLVWLAITFAFLYLMMSRVALPRIATVLEERKDRIARDLDQARELEEQAEEAIRQYEQALADARAKAHAIASETQAAIRAEVERQRQETDQQIEERVKAAEARIRDMKQSAMANVGEVAGEAAGAIVEKLLGNAPDASTVQSAVSSELAKQDEGRA